MIKKFFNLQFKKACPAKRERSGGFTVLESIVAIFVLSLSISGVFSAVQQSLSQATLSKEEVRAFYLAQEAVEIIRNKRDSNQLKRISTNAGNWLTDISAVGTDNCYFGKVCRLDVASMGSNYCGTEWGSCPVLRQDASNFIYGYDSSDPATNFKREIQLESVNADEIAVIVRISWTKGVITRDFKFKTYLLNWAK